MTLLIPYFKFVDSLAVSLLLLVPKINRIFSFSCVRILMLFKSFPFPAKPLYPLRSVCSIPVIHLVGFFKRLWLLAVCWCVSPWCSVGLTLEWAVLWGESPLLMKLGHSSWIGSNSPKKYTFSLLPEGLNPGSRVLRLHCGKKNKSPQAAGVH